MHVFVIGVDGYMGCVLAPFLIKEGHEVGDQNSSSDSH
jgi:nucleoside-diphosphate-sugar epimerase